MSAFIDVHLKLAVLACHGLPDVAYRVHADRLMQVLSETGELPLAELLYGLQDYTQAGDAAWRTYEPAMDRLAEMLSPLDDRQVISAEGEYWWLEVGPVDLTGPIVTVQRGDDLIAAASRRDDGRLRVAVYRPLDAKSARYLTGMGQKPHPVHGVCMRENNWEYALDSSAGFRHWYADERGEPYLSNWAHGLGITDSGEVIEEWRNQLTLLPRPSIRVVVELGVHHAHSSEEATEEAPLPATAAEAPAWPEFLPPTWPGRRQQRRTVQGRFQGCLLGGAVGDALGAPVEFLKRSEIREHFGAKGITQYAPAYGGLGTITDDTQMTLFTAEGLLRGWVRGRFKGITHYPSTITHAYLRWLHTQGERAKVDIPLTPDAAGWLYQQAALHHRRAPGNTCLSALRLKRSLDDPADNLSKGCGGVMRVAPVGLFAWRLGWQAMPEEAFRLGADVAAITHGHTTGALTGGVLAVLVLALVDGASLPNALYSAKDILMKHSGYQETMNALELAEMLARRDTPIEEAIRQLGEGWVAEESLAIAVYCALKARSFRQGVIMAVNHDGDSDSTGAIAGNLLGAMYGQKAIPDEWLQPLELKEVVAELAADLYAFADWDIGEFSHDERLNQQVWEKYPGH